MRILGKACVVLLPFAAVFFALRACSSKEGRRWQGRIAAVDPEVAVVVDAPDLLLLAPDPGWGRLAAKEARSFKTALERNYGDLLGHDRGQRLVVVLFSSLDRLRRYAGRRAAFAPDALGALHGYTDSSQGAIYLPPNSTLDTLHHELVHWVVKTSYSGLVQLSPWLSEGLAQLFERYRPGRRAPGLGTEARARIPLVIPRGGIDLDRLLGIKDYQDFVKGEVGRNYLEALVLTAFLFERRPRPLLRSYIEAEREHQSGRRMEFDRIYHPGTAAFRRDLEAFVRGP